MNRYKTSQGRELESEYERNCFERQEKEFTYSSQIPYIVLAEEKTQIDPLSLEYLPFADHSTPTNCLLLDPDLAIVQKSSEIRNLEKELQQKYEEEAQAPSLSFLTGKYDFPVSQLETIRYQKYNSMNDFVFGRTGFVRNLQSIRIQSQTISKHHCSILHPKPKDCSSKQKYKFLQKLLPGKTPISSKWRKLSPQLWSLINRYYQSGEKYMLVDKGSRNGTWVTEIDKKVALAKQKFEYQFDGKSYSLFINRIFSSSETKGLTVIQHNERVSKLIEQFRREVNWCYYEPAKKSIILGAGQQISKVAEKSDEKIEVLVLKIKYRENHEFYFFGIPQSSSKKFKIGSKQEVDIYMDEDQMPTLDGNIIIDQGKWSIEVGRPRKIWQKIPKDFNYPLFPKSSYKIKIGYRSTFDLQFFNF